MGKTYNCPKCRNRTVQFSEMSKSLVCTHMDYVTGQGCKFIHSMPNQTVSPNDSQVLTELGKYK